MLSEGYIGVSKNPKERWRYHKWKNETGRSENPIFKNAINKYGWDNLIKKIILCADSDYCYSMEKLLRPTKEIGWNFNIGGVKPPVSKSRGPNYVSPLKGKKVQTPWMFGAKHALGKKASDATRKKISLAVKGRKHTSEHLEKRMLSRRITRLAKGQIKSILVNNVKYEDSKIASTAVNIPESTLKYWAYGKGKIGPKYAHITECRWI